MECRRGVGLLAVTNNALLVWMDQSLETDSILGDSSSQRLAK